MGRRWKRNKKNKHTGEGKSRDDNNNDGNDNDKKKDDEAAAKNNNKDYGKERDPYKLISGGNFKMEAYYTYQGLHEYSLNKETGQLVKCTTHQQKEDERQRWSTCLKSILPASFRIGNDVDIDLRQRLEKELDDYVGKKMEIIVEPKGGDRRIQELDLKPTKKMISPVQQIPYIPHAYQLGIDRQTIRRNTSLKPFFEWLKIQTAAGFVTRQETVSMIPPVVLNPNPSDKILDMCAAPGSKTTQLLEIVNIPTKSNDTEPTGFVVANDADSKRAYMLVHHLRRINSPAMFISTCDAQFFPLLASEDHPTEGLFDKVLCDVPCSGDGTARKNPGVWKNWSQLGAYGLHALQLSIALKGARMTKVGGYMCYSTCSMNPIENEAVVAELLRASEGSLELVDRKKDLEGLLSRPGMSFWKVLSEDKSKRSKKNFIKKNNPKMKARRKEWEEKNNNKQQPSGDGDAAAKGDGNDAPMDGVVNDSKKEEGEEEKDEDDDKRVPINTPFEPKSFDGTELKEMIAMAGLKEYTSVDELPLNLQSRIRQTCFPPTKEEIENFHLDRCIRILPQDMDTGGFFVTLLKKVAPMNARARKRFQKLEEELNSPQEGKEEEEESGDEPKLKRAKVDEGETGTTGTSGDDDVADGGFGGGTTTDMSMEDDNGGGGGEEKTSDADAAGGNGGGKNDDDGKGLVAGEKDGDNVVRGQNKKNFLRDKDGNKHATLGKDDFVPFTGDLMAKLKDFYGLTSERFDEKKYMIRAGGEAKVLYFICDSVKDLIDKGIQQRITVVHSGLKAFVRNNQKCECTYRVAQEGVQFVAPHMTKRRYSVTIEDFKKCLTTGIIQIKDISEPFAEFVRPLVFGSFVVQLEGYEIDYIKKLSLVMWRGRSDTISAMVERQEIDGMKSKLRAITGEDDEEEKPNDDETSSAPAAAAKENEAETK